MCRSIILSAKHLVDQIICWLNILSANIKLTKKCVDQIIFGHMAQTLPEKFDWKND